MSMIFLGKWTLAQGTNVVQINMASGALSLGPMPSDGSQNFNAYGTANAFILQGANGLYVVASGDGYGATKAASDPLNQFALIDNGSGSYSVCDLGINGGGATQYDWNADFGALKRIAEIRCRRLGPHFSARRS